MSMAKEHQKFKILMFPWLAHGHIHPFLELSKTLSSRNFIIYLCSSAVNLDSIKSKLSDDDYEETSIKLVELQIPSSSELPPHLHTTKNLPSDLTPALLQALQKSSSSFSDILDSVNPDLLIYDLFQPWAPKMASLKGIPSVYFSTSGATPFAYYHHVHTMGSASTFPYKAISVSQDEMDRVIARIAPNINGAGDDFGFGILSRSSEIVLIKSSRDVEEKYIDYLSVLCKKQIVCTGPLIANSNDGGSLEIIEWLNGRDFRSTIYISFGSECFLSKDQIAEVAKGLQSCHDVNFLWVIRFPDGEKIGCIEDELPKGFVEKTKGRGLVVSKWAPQTKILGHQSVGGFVSHCGWSSVMESLYFGVPIIAMPMKSEQPINAQLVVESGVGVGVERDGNGVYVGEEVAKAISKVVVEKAFYESVEKMSETMKAKEYEEIKEVAEHLLRICMKNKTQI